MELGVVRWGITGTMRCGKLGTIGVEVRASLGVENWTSLLSPTKRVISNEFYHQQKVSLSLNADDRRSGGSGVVSFENFGRGEEMQARTKAKSRSRRTFPDLSPFDLWNAIDIANAHTLLTAMGHAHDSYDGLHQVTLAAVLARRLATTNKAGYFAHIVRHGFSQHGPADKDFETAKRIIREIHGWDQR